MLKTYNDIRSAIAFIMRRERGLSKHRITEAAIAATRVLYTQPTNGGNHGNKTRKHRIA